MKKNNNLPTKKILVLVCFLFATTFAFFTYKSYTAYQETQKDLEQKAAKMETLKTEIAEIKSTIQNYEKEKEEFSQLLFQERDVPAFLDGFSESAKKAQINIIDMQTRGFAQVKVPTELQSDYQRKRSQLGQEDQVRDKKQEVKEIITLSAMPIQIQLKGTFESIVNFLTSLEGYKQLLTVSNVEISVERDYPTLKCAFTLKIYSLKSLAELEK